MLRVRVARAIGAAPILAASLVCPSAAGQPRVPGALGEIAVPGGVAAAAAAIGDPAAVDRAQFLVEFVRRSYDAPAREIARSPQIAALLAHLGSRADEPGDSVPLPLPPDVWKEAVFDHPIADWELLGAILRSREAALLYYGLLRLDDATRAWLAERPGVVRNIATGHAATFVTAAAALRIANDVVQVPGGRRAESIWESLVGQRTRDPAAFVTALLAIDEGRLAYFYGGIGALRAHQLALALRLDADASERDADARRLYTVFRRLASGWNIRDRPFRRPPLDPALLAADLQVDDSGRPVLPGTRQFWSAVFARADAADGAEAIAHGGAPAVSYAWLCEQVFRFERGRAIDARYYGVLFASRLGATLAGVSPRDAVDAVRAALEYPGLAAAIERARIMDPSVFAAAARRADQLSGIRQQHRQIRAIAQYQGIVALLLRAASRGGLTRESAADLLSSLSAVGQSRRGDYDGRLVRWLTERVGGSDDDLLTLLAGPAPASRRVVEWEGASYVVDLAHAERVRLTRLLGDQPRPYVASARRVLSLADALEVGRADREPVRASASDLEDVALDVGWDDGDTWAPDVVRRYRRAAGALARLSAGGDAARAHPEWLRELADDLLARGLIVFVHAVALGQPDRVAVVADEVARRHAFRVGRPPAAAGPWDVPVIGAGAAASQSTVGSLLGLDVAHADLGLVPLSSRPPARKPMIGAAARRAFAETLALVDSALLRDEDGRAIGAALREGRARIAAIRTAAEASAVVGALRLDAARASLLPWVVAHDRERLPAFLSFGELLELGLGASDGRALQAWGAVARPRLGCLCLWLPRGLPWEIVTGRPGSGMLVTVFPDLNLRLAELLAEMEMPASLLGPVLASATHEFVTTAISRSPDDRRGLLEFVQALDAERLEYYLAVLTTDGPLVPMELHAQQESGFGGRE